MRRVCASSRGEMTAVHVGTDSPPRLTAKDVDAVRIVNISGDFDLSSIVADRLADASRDDHTTCARGDACKRVASWRGSNTLGGFLKRRTVAVRLNA